MHRALRIVIAVGFAFGSSAALGQETFPAVPAAGAQPETQEATKDASAGKGEAGATKRESNPKKPDTSSPDNSPENRTQEQPERKQDEKIEGKTAPLAEGQSGAKSAESKTGAATEAPAQSVDEAQAESKEETDKKANTAAEGQRSPRGADVGAVTAGAGGESAAGSPASDTAPAAVPAPHKKPRKVVVREGGASEPPAQIVTGMTIEEASSQGNETEQLVDSAEEYLRRLLGRPLDAEQQGTVSQIHNYVAHARAAIKEGDISRGHTLAMKANLLAEDLVKH